MLRASKGFDRDREQRYISKGVAEYFFIDNIGKRILVETFNGIESKGLLAAVQCNQLYILNITGAVDMIRFEDLRYLKTI